MEYSFDVMEAKSYGLNEAIMIKNFRFWILKNRANDKNYFEVEIEENGQKVKYARTWTYNTKKAFAKLFPFWTERQIERIIKSLKDQNIIITAQLSKDKWDKTNYYAFKDEELFLDDEHEEIDRTTKTVESISANGEIEETKQGDRTNETERSISENGELLIQILNTDNNTDINTDKKADKSVYDKKALFKDLKDTFAYGYEEYHNHKIENWEKETIHLKNIIKRVSRSCDGDVGQMKELILEKIGRLRAYVENPQNEFEAGFVFLPSQLNAVWDRLVDKRHFRKKSKCESSLNKNILKQLKQVGG